MEFLLVTSTLCLLHRPFVRYIDLLSVMLTFCQLHGSFVSNIEPLSVTSTLCQWRQPFVSYIDPLLVMWPFVSYVDPFSVTSTLCQLCWPFVSYIKFSLWSFFFCLTVMRVSILCSLNIMINLKWVDQLLWLFVFLKNWLINLSLDQLNYNYNNLIFEWLIFLTFCSLDFVLDF